MLLHAFSTSFSLSLGCGWTGSGAAEDLCNQHLLKSTVLPQYNHFFVFHWHHLSHCAPRKTQSDCLNIVLLMERLAMGTAFSYFSLTPFFMSLPACSLEEIIQLMWPRPAFQNLAFLSERFAS